MLERRIELRVSQETYTEIEALSTKLGFTFSATAKLLLKYGLEKMNGNGE